MRDVREQIEDAENEREGDLEQAELDQEHYDAGRLLGALPTMTHQERYAGREEMEAGS